MTAIERVVEIVLQLEDPELLKLSASGLVRVVELCDLKSRTVRTKAMIARIGYLTSELEAFLEHQKFKRSEREKRKAAQEIKLRVNPYGRGTNEYYQREAKIRGFGSVKELMDHLYAEAPVCPHCGTRQGFAHGTGDCGCDPDPDVGAGFSS